MAKRWRLDIPELQLREDGKTERRIVLDEAYSFNKSFRPQPAKEATATFSIADQEAMTAKKNLEEVQRRIDTAKPSGSWSFRSVGPKRRLDPSSPEEKWGATRSKPSPNSIVWEFQRKTRPHSSGLDAKHQAGWDNTRS